MAPNDGEEKLGGLGHNAVVLARLRAMRWSRDSYNDVILRIAAAE